MHPSKFEAYTGQSLPWGSAEGQGGAKFHLMRDTPEGSFSYCGRYVTASKQAAMSSDKMNADAVVCIECASVLQRADVERRRLPDA